MQRITQTVRMQLLRRFELQGRAVTANLRAAGCDPNPDRTYGTNATLSTSPTATRQQRDQSCPLSRTPGDCRHAIPQGVRESRGSRSELRSGCSGDTPSTRRCRAAALARHCGQPRRSRPSGDQRYSSWTRWPSLVVILATAPASQEVARASLERLAGNPAPWGDQRACTPCVVEAVHRMLLCPHGPRFRDESRFTRRGSRQSRFLVEHGLHDASVRAAWRLLPLEQQRRHTPALVGRHQQWRNRSSEAPKLGLSPSDRCDIFE
jgi:hypothetical protein